MKPTRRTAFFVSDRTGITAEMLGHTLLTQFPDLPVRHVVRPFVDSIEQAQTLRAEINRTADVDAIKPLVFCTLIDQSVRDIIAGSDAFVVDFMQSFVPALESELNTVSTPRIGLSHRINDASVYEQRMDAINYALSHDDGLLPHQFDQADIILIGVSRCGKTPTCLYLAIQHAIRAANYPLTPDDFEQVRLPVVLDAQRNKLFGLTIAPARLQQIRQQRRPDSQYSSTAQCEFETRQAKSLFQAQGIPVSDSTTMSIEEIARTILHRSHLRNAT